MIIQTLAIQKQKIATNNFNLKINSCFHNISVNQLVKRLSKFIIFKNQRIQEADKK